MNSTLCALIVPDSVATVQEQSDADLHTQCLWGADLGPDSERSGHVALRKGKCLLFHGISSLRSRSPIQEKNILLPMDNYTILQVKMSSKVRIGELYHAWRAAQATWGWVVWLDMVFLITSQSTEINALRNRQRCELHRQWKHQYTLLYTFPHWLLCTLLQHHHIVADMM